MRLPKSTGVSRVSRRSPVLPLGGRSVYIQPNNCFCTFFATLSTGKRKPNAKTRHDAEEQDTPPQLAGSRRKPFCGACARQSLGEIGCDQQRDKPPNDQNRKLTGSSG